MFQSPVPGLAYETVSGVRVAPAVTCWHLLSPAVALAELPGHSSFDIDMFPATVAAISVELLSRSQLAALSVHWHGNSRAVCTHARLCHALLVAGSGWEGLASSSTAHGNSRKADSHIPCRSPATTLPFSDSALSFVKFPYLVHKVLLLSPSRNYLLLSCYHK
jgi:hypothetical protein